jgi:hypothetical protein
MGVFFGEDQCLFLFIYYLSLSSVGKFQIPNSRLLCPAETSQKLDFRGFQTTPIHVSRGERM